MRTAKWMKTLIDKYTAGVSNAFILTGNIYDYALAGFTVKDYLVEKMKELNPTEIATFNIGTGLDFHGLKGSERETGWQYVYSRLLKDSGRVVMIVEYPEFFVPAVGNYKPTDEERERLIMMHKLLNDSRFLNSDHILIFMTETQKNMHNMFLDSGTRTAMINVDFPNEDERREFVHHLHATSHTNIRYDIDLKRFARLTAGLTLVNLEDIFLIAESTGQLNKQMIMDRKKELIAKEYGEVIEIYDTDGLSLDDFAGQEHIKSYHREVVINPILEGDTTIVPKGLLYMGPPGTGKTYFSKCLAGDANINFVEFKMSKILDKYVGNAEKNLEKALRCFESLAPVGVFIDEVDQALQRGENDTNAVSRNLFGMFLAFLSEPAHRGKILWIGATNYPNKMDEALKRAGRFDKKIPFLPPTKEERINVFDIHLNKNGYPYEVKNKESLGALTEGYTQAEIENVVVKALEIAHRKKLSVITDDTLTYAIDCMITSKNERITEMTNIALDECNDKEFLPTHYKQKR